MIHLRHVTIHREGKLILDELSLDIERGEHCAVIGPNGAGKSTFVGVITKEVHPLQRDDLEISIYGRTLWNVPALRSRIGIVSDSMAQLCSTAYTARDIVISGFVSSIGIASHHKVTETMENRAQELLEFMGTADLAEQPMNRLSTGEAKRVLIARAMVHAPETLILDEPASNLDLKTQSLLKQTLRTIAAQGTQLILVTHDLSDIIPEISKVILLKDGKLFGQGSKQELLTAKVLSELYDTRVFVDRHDGWYKAWC